MPRGAIIVSDIWYVYLLIDPRDNRPFYVGCTKNPRNRFDGHHSDWANRTRRRIIEIKEAGHGCKMWVVRAYNTKAEARDYEDSLIASHMANGTRLLNGTFFNILKSNNCLWLRANPDVAPYFLSRLQRGDQVPEITGFLPTIS